MSSRNQIGEISDVHGKVHLIWKINCFFSYNKENISYRSPEIHALNSVWKIEVWPCGDNSTGWVSLYLIRIDDGTSKSVDFTFGIQTKNNSIECKKKATWKTNNQGWGWPKFMERAELEKMKENLLPTRNLIIICSLIVKDDQFDMDGCKDKLAADFKNMFVSKKSTDVTIKVKEETFSVNKFVLSARSPVLAAMFETEMIEKKTGFIDITDCDPKAFHLFLIYLYSGELESEKCDFLNLYKIADKYCVSDLKLMCIDFLIHNISFETFCEIYLFGTQFNETKLLTTAQNFFNENFAEIISSANWLSMLKEETELANNLFQGFASQVKIEK